MNTSVRSGLSFWVAFATFACSGSPDPGNPGAGGSAPQGGQAPSSGGTPASGTTGNGGAPPNGGAPANGGAVGTSGTTNGGAVASGGSTTIGGATGMGGTANGGTANGGGTGKGGTSNGGTANGGGTGKGGTSNGGTSNGGSSSGTGGGGGSTSTTMKFSFFVTSIGAMRELSKNENGFGGDLRFGEATGLAGADKICRTIAEKAMPGAGQKEWRAFLSTVGFEGQPQVNAIDRIGKGPWYDRFGRLVASSLTTLNNERPSDADPTIKDDLPNEDGIPNHKDGAPTCTGNSCPDNHDVLTGTGPNGKLYNTANYTTCNDWTSSAGQPGMPGGGSGAGGSGAGTGGRGGGGFPQAKGPWCGHSWPRDLSGKHWMSALAEGGCAPGVNLAETGGPQQGVYTVGTGGGYGAIYCFALTP